VYLHHRSVLVLAGELRDDLLRVLVSLVGHVGFLEVNRDEDLAVMKGGRVVRMLASLSP
jgi:hypothetical protein